MKLRHAAAIVLSGWYLLLPPRPSTKSFWGFDANAPYLDWDIVAKFKTVDDCQKKLRLVRNAAAPSPSDIKRMRRSGSKPLVGAELKDANEYMSHAMCISTDDPGLNEQ